MWVLKILVACATFGCSTVQSIRFPDEESCWAAAARVQFAVGKEDDHTSVAFCIPADQDSLR